jgi:hypothetical protein
MSFSSSGFCAQLAGILLSLSFSEKKKTSSSRCSFRPPFIIDPFKFCYVPQLATRIGGSSESNGYTWGIKVRPSRYAGSNMSSANPEGATRAASARVGVMGTKVLDVWRDFVNRRWNAEARFLNLEVSSWFGFK